MNGGGMGVGSASLMLVFSVLCLTIFALISFSSALDDKAMMAAEARMVKAYYEADSLAEAILTDLNYNGESYVSATASSRDITFEQGFDWDTFAETLSFACPVSFTKELYVVLSFGMDGMDILTWRMRNIHEWEAEEDFELGVWSGFDGFFGGFWDGD